VVDGTATPETTGGRKGGKEGGKGGREETLLDRKARRGRSEKSSHSFLASHRLLLPPSLQPL
jgi:hypothetical protein